jgi:hypothetical protein
MQQDMKLELFKHNAKVRSSSIRCANPMKKMPNYYKPEIKRFILRDAACFLLLETCVFSCVALQKILPIFAKK